MAGIWQPGWGFWWVSPSGSINDPNVVKVPYGQQGSSATVMPQDPGTYAPAQPTMADLTKLADKQAAEAKASTDRSAKATLTATLSLYGLASLADFAWKEYLKDIPIEQIMLDIRQTPEYISRFPAMKALADKGQAINEAQYINYETSASALMKSAGLPPGFYDQPTDFTEFLTNNLALPELQARIEIAKAAVYNSDPATLAALQSFYGIQGGLNYIGDATAYFLDPDRALPTIEKQFIAAQEAGAASRAGYGALSMQDAERLANLGITPDVAQRGFGTLATLTPLFANLPGEAGTAPTAEQGLQAVFEGNAQAQQVITDQASKRKAVFAGGGAFSQTAGGLTGI